MKCGETVVTLPDKFCNRKCNELVLEPRLRIRSIQKYQYDNLHMILDSDHSITVGSPCSLHCYVMAVTMQVHLSHSKVHMCVYQLKTCQVELWHYLV